MLYRELIVIAFILLCVFAGVQIKKFVMFIVESKQANSKQDVAPKTILPAVAAKKAAPVRTQRSKQTSQKQKRSAQRKKRTTK